MVLEKLQPGMLLYLRQPEEHDQWRGYSLDIVTVDDVDAEEGWVTILKADGDVVLMRRKQAQDVLYLRSEARKLKHGPVRKGATDTRKRVKYVR